MKNVAKLDALQIESILDKLVPLIAAPEDQEFFRGVLGISLESCKSSAAAAVLVQDLLREASA